MVTKPPSFKHQGCPEARTFAQLANECLISRKPDTEAAKKANQESLKKRINSCTTKATGWDIPTYAGLKGGAPSAKVGKTEKLL